MKKLNEKTTMIELGTILKFLASSNHYKILTYLITILLLIKSEAAYCQFQLIVNEQTIC